MAVVITKTRRRRTLEPETVPEILAHVGDLLVTIEAAKIELDRQARRARARGATWQQIAAKLGVSPQTARQRYS